MRFSLLWERLAFSKLTICYFAFAFIHCVLQIAFQTRAFIVNKQAAQLITDQYQYGTPEIRQITQFGFADLSDDEQSISWCTRLGHRAGDTSNCTVLWPTASDYDQSQNTAAQVDVETSLVVETMPVTSSISTVSATAIQSAHIVSASAPARTDTTTTTSSPISSTIASSAGRASSTSSPAAIPSASSTVNGLSSQKRTLVKRSHPEDAALQEAVCLQALVWPTIELDNTKREDLAFLLFQIWVLGMSTVAILNESIPHTIAAFLTHLVSTGWGAYQIFSTARFHRNFARVILNGACAGSDLLTGYWEQRNIAEIPSLALNVAALGLSVFFTLRLIKQFGWQTYKHVGANLTIARIYRLVLLLSILIQFGLFFVLTTVALWLDQIRHGRIGQYSQSRKAFTIICAVVLVATIPWLMTGWFGVRRESRLLLVLFLGLCIMYMGGWAIMLLSLPFRWTFVVWNFFGLVATLSVAFTFFAFGLGVMCLLNFGKGLPSYLRDQAGEFNSPTSEWPRDGISHDGQLGDVESQRRRSCDAQEVDLRRQISIGGASISSTSSAQSASSWLSNHKSLAGSMSEKVVAENSFVIE